LRPQNVYGALQELSNPYTGILGVLTNGIARNGRVELFEDGKMTRDFVFAGDVARAFVAGIEHSGPLSCTLNVGSSQPVTLRDLTKLLAELIGREPTVDCLGRYRLGDVRHASADMRAYESVIGPWRPTALRDGLTEYLGWFMEQPAPPAGCLDAALSEMSNRNLLLEAN
jgi:dTDP-L-rhamnose 4-epimerase